MIQRVDLHAHTRFSEWKHLKFLNPRDSYSLPLDVFRRCKQLGMDFVAITDHDSIDGAIDLLSQHPELEPEVIIGEEVETVFPDTGQWVHVNVFDIDEATHADVTRLKPNIRELIPYLRQRGIFHVLNHPFQSYRLQKAPQQYMEELLEMFDHFEVGNATLSARHNAAVEDLLAHAAAFYIKKNGVGGSDAHHLGDLGLYWTEVDVEGAALDKRAWLAAVAAGRCRSVGRTIGAAGLTANVYRIIWSYYCSLAKPEGRRGMGPLSHVAAAVALPACIAGVPAAVTFGNSLKVEAVSALVRRELKRMGELRESTLPESARADQGG